MDQTTPGLYYRHSGSFGSTALPLMLVASAIAATIGGVIYAYGIVYIPFIYIKFILTAAYGGLLGWAVGAAGKALKVRNMTLMTLAGVFAGLVGVYAMWPTWMGVMIQRGIAEEGGSLGLADEARVIWAFASNPSDLFAAMGAMGETGVWAFKDITPTGWGLYAFWIIEALAVIGISAAVAGGYLSDLPFCERCDRWMDEKLENAALMPPLDSKATLAQLEAKDFGATLALRSAHPAMALRAKLRLRSCPSCGESHALDYLLTETKQTGKNQTQTTEHPLAKNLLMDRAAADAFKKLIASPAPAPTDEELAAMFPPAEGAAVEAKK